MLPPTPGAPRRGASSEDGWRVCVDVDVDVEEKKGKGKGKDDDDDDQYLSFPPNAYRVRK